MSALQQQLAPRISIVVAVAENGVIGNRGDLPWRLSGDLQRFKKLTMGHALIMGRKTYESIGRALPGRVSIVLTNQEEYEPSHPAVLVARSLAEAVGLVATTEMEHDEVFVVGGAEIYRLALPQAATVYRTVVHASPAGDARFAELDADIWRLVESQEYEADAQNEYASTWQKWERIEAGAART